MNRKTNYFSLLLWALFYLAIFFFFLHNSFDYLDPDFGWHLKIGQEIWQNHDVPRLVTHYYTLAGQPWVDHEWLSNVLLFLIYNHAGYVWLSIIFALLPTTVIFVLNFFIKNFLIASADSAAVFAFLLPLEILGAPAIAPHSGVRIQEIGVLFLLLLLIIIYKFAQSKNWRYLLLLTPLLFLWSCLHGSFLIAIFLLFFWLGAQIAAKIIRHYLHYPPAFAKEENFATKDLIIFSVGSCLAIGSTLLNPYGIQLYIFLTQLTSNFYAHHISEWLPVYTYPIQYFQMFFLAIIIGWLSIYFINYLPTRKTAKPNETVISYWELAILLIFFCLAFKSRRNFPLFFVTSLIIIIKIVIAGLPPLNFHKIFSYWLIKLYMLIALLLTIAMLILKTNFTDMPFTNYKFCQAYPCQAINFLKNSPLDNGLRIFSNYDWGGFMTWVWPEKKLFIDGRMPQYPYQQRTIMEEYYDFFDSNKTAEKLAEYNIQLVLLKINQPITIRWWEKFFFSIEENKYNNLPNYLQKYLDASPDWRLVYNDKISRVYAKNNIQY